MGNVRERNYYFLLTNIWSAVAFILSTIEKNILAVAPPVAIAFLYILLVLFTDERGEA
jgi:uncharacterized membrane protein YccF (DUF307 family)